MAKQSGTKGPLSEGLTKVLMTLLLLAAGGWWLWNHDGGFQEALSQYVENGDLLTLESKYTPKQIMEAHRAELIGTQNRTYREATLKYVPYLLMEVKDTEGQKTREGILLWSMEDGEVVLNSETWETTHGLKDCLECEATRNDFKIIQALAARPTGTASIQELQKDLHLDHEAMVGWLDSARRKHLIVQQGNIIQLHFENPKLLIIPQKRMKQNLVLKPAANAKKVPKTFSKSQIVKIAKAAFGHDFSIRSEKEVFLPIYSLEVLNADGSVQVTDWNALNGQRIAPKYM